MIRMRLFGAGILGLLLVDVTASAQVQESICITKATWKFGQDQTGKTIWWLEVEGTYTGAPAKLNEVVLQKIVATTPPSFQNWGATLPANPPTWNGTNGGDFKLDSIGTYVVPATVTIRVKGYRNGQHVSTSIDYNKHFP